MIFSFSHMKQLFSLLFSVLLSAIVFAQIPNKAEDIAPLLIGEMVPSVKITAIDGEKKNLLDVVAKRPTVLLFYRGGWCPYCNRHLAAVGKSEQEILKMGYQVVGVAPDAPGQLNITREKNTVTYKIYSDVSCELMKAMGIAFNAPERYDEKLDKYSGKLNPGLLPVPSVFIIDTDGTILFEYISPNYKQRMSAELLMDVLKNLKTAD